MVTAEGPATATPRIVQRMEDYDPWEEMVGKNKLYHPVSPGASPLRDEQDVILKDVQLEGIGYSKKRKKEQPQPRETVKGRIGEFAIGLQYQSDGVPCVDANVAIQKNVAGIDHIISWGDFCFSQSKVHVDGDDETNLNAYMTDIDNRTDMASLFIQKVGPSATLLGKLVQANKDVGKHATLTKIIKELTENSSDYDSPGDIDDSLKAVKWVAESMVFPVPSDLYDQLPKSYRKLCYRMTYDKQWFISSLRKIQYMEKKTKLSEEDKEVHEDGDFKL